MFIMIEDNYLKMNRGDSYEIPLVINEGTKLCFKQYQLRQFDKIYVGIMENNQSFENAIIRKVISITSPVDSYGHPLLQILPEDTEYLLTGKYFIEIKILQVDGNTKKITTLLPLKEFFIMGTNKQVNSNTYNYYKSVNISNSNAKWEELENKNNNNMDKTEYEWIQI